MLRRPDGRVIKCRRCSAELRPREHPDGCGCFFACDRCLPESEFTPPVDKFDSRKTTLRQVPIKLRSYQEAAVEAIRSKISSGAQFVMCNLATGAGKTSVANAYINRHADGEVLWLAPTCELLEQAEQNCICHPSPQPARRRLGLAFNLPHVLRRTSIASGTRATVIYQTLQARYMKKADSSNVSLIVWDECHWAERTKMGQLVLKYAKKHQIPVLGLTASPHQETEYSVAYQAPLLHLAAQGYLARPMIHAYGIPGYVPVGEDEQSNVRLDEFPAAVEPETPADIVKFWLEDPEKWGKTLIKVSTIDVGSELQTYFLDIGVQALMIHHRKGRAERKQCLQTYREAGKSDVLIGINICFTGLDVPDIDSVFLTHKIGEPRYYLQVLGRGARLAQDKRTFNIVEFHPAFKSMRSTMTDQLKEYQLEQSMEAKRTVDEDSQDEDDGLLPVEEESFEDLFWEKIDVIDETSEKAPRGAVLSSEVQAAALGAPRIETAFA